MGNEPATLPSTDQNRAIMLAWMKAASRPERRSTGGLWNGGGDPRCAGWAAHRQTPMLSRSFGDFCARPAPEYLGRY